MKLQAFILLCVAVWGLTEGNSRFRRDDDEYDDSSRQEPLDCRDNTSDDTVGALTHIGNIVTNLNDNIRWVKRDGLDSDLRNLRQALDEASATLNKMLGGSSAMTSSDSKDQLNTSTDKIRHSVDNISGYGTGDIWACRTLKGAESQKFKKFLNDVNSANSREIDGKMEKLVQYLLFIDDWDSGLLA